MTTEPLSIFTILNQVNQVIALYYNLSKHQVSNSLGNPVGDERAVKAKIGLIRKEIYFNPFYQYASDFISLKIKEVIEGTGNQEIDEVLQDKNCSFLEEIYTVILDELVDYFNNDNLEEIPLREEWKQFLTMWIDKFEITLSLEETFSSE